MTRCQHCNRLTHSEDLIVEYDVKDQEKIDELRDLVDWVPKYMYNSPENYSPYEYGKLKCGDIWIHFRVKIEKVI